MALLKFLRRPGTSTETASSGAASAAAQAVQTARQQARRRLVGAVVLLGIGIIGFPLVFQTQPRPIPVDIPIEIPNRDKVGALTVGSAEAASPGAAAAPLVPEPARGGAAAVLGGALDGAPAGSPAGPLTAASTARAAAVSADKGAGTAPVEVEVLPPARGDAGKAVASKSESTKAEADKDRGRFVVQAGSYTDLDAVREVRQKLERMGLKTYTQAAVIEGVTRVRVRVGPFSSKQEAQEVQNKIKAAGVASSLLQL